MTDQVVERDEERAEADAASDEARAEETGGAGILRGLTLGVREKLFAAFGAIATLTLVAAAVAIFAFGQVQTSFETLVDKGVTAIGGVAKLASQSNRVSIAASDLAKAKFEQDRAAAHKQLVGAVGKLSEQIDGLIAQGSLATDGTALKEKVAEFKSDLERLDKATKDKLAARERKSGKLTELFQEHEDITLAFVPIVDDTYFEAVIGGENVAKESNKIVDKVVNKDVIGLRALLEARAEAGLLSGLLMSAGLAGHGSFQPIFEDKAIAAKRRLQAALERLRKNSGGRPAKAKIDVLLGFVSGKDSIFKSEDLGGFVEAKASGETLRRILDLQQAIDNALITALDDHTFDLAIGAEKAVEDNGRLIGQVMNDQVTMLRNALEASSTVHQLVAVIVRGALTEDEGQLTPLQDQVNSIAARFQAAAMASDNADVISKSLVLATFADPDSGVLSDRRAEFASDRLSDKLVAEMFGRSTELGGLLDAVIDAQGTSAAGDAQAVRELISTQQLLLVALGVASLAIAGLIGLFIVHRGLMRPIGSLIAAMRQLAEGDTSVSLQEQDRRDEIGDMIRAVGVFRQNAVERAVLEAEQERRNTARVQRQEQVDGLIGTFKSTVSELLSAVGTDTKEMQSTAEILTSVADDTDKKAGAASDASDEAARNVSSVASATEELSASISEISRQVHEATDSVTCVGGQVEAATEKVSGLAGAVDKIGNVVGLIHDIAEQTNLLALNATIEAARAGDAGKGFAVVASEVKALANQTARATDEISASIDEIQGSTGEAVDAIGVISKTMEDVSRFTTAIASAVEQQGAATGKISESFEQAAEGSRGVTENMNGLSLAVSETKQSASHVELASANIVNHTEALSDAVDTFLNDVAAA